jgi:prolipoprotein diacylglyceryltransferase
MDPIHLRIGAWVLHPNALLFPVAGLYFVILANRALRPAFSTVRMSQWWAVAALALGGLMGARLYGMVQPWLAEQPVIADGAWRTLQFGSIGGIWGVLLAAGCVAMVTRRLIVVDAILPALCVSAGIARLSCVFQGCCPGLHMEQVAIFPDPQHSWPLLDITALAISGWFVRRRIEAGIPTVLFLVLYGTLRFNIETFRDTFTATGGLTWGQVAALSQMAFALLIAAILTTRRKTG